MMALGPKPLDRGSHVRIPRVDAGQRLAFEFAGEDERLRRLRIDAETLEHLEQMLRVELVDDLFILAALPICFVRPAGIGDESLGVRLPPRVGWTSEACGQES